MVRQFKYPCRIPKLSLADRAPDGSCLMSNSDDDTIRLFNTPSSLYDVTDWKGHPCSEEMSLEPVLSVPEGGQVYDYAWYPLMSSYDPATSWYGN